MTSRGRTGEPGQGFDPPLSASPPNPEIQAVLRAQSPWFDRPREDTIVVPPYARAHLETIDRAYRSPTTGRRFHVLVGPRRVGKTTILKQLVHRWISHGVAAMDVAFVRVDHPRLINVPLGTIVEALLWMRGRRHGRMRVLLDEVASARDWHLWLKAFYDEDWPIDVFATASSAMLLRKGGADAGIGRWVEHRVGPMDLLDIVRLTPGMFPIELARESSVPSVADRVHRPLHEALLTAAASPARDTNSLEVAVFWLLNGGGSPESTLALARAYPQVLASIGGRASAEAPLSDPELLLRFTRALADEVRAQLRSDVVDRVLYKDIPLAARVNEPASLERLLYSLAGRSGSIVEPSSLAKDLGLAKATLERYLDLLEGSMLVNRLPAWGGSEAVTQRRGRKVYFRDPAIREAMLQRPALAFLDDPSAQGAAYEAVVASHLQSLAEATNARLYYARSRDYEVDFLLERGEDRVALEVGRSHQHSRKSLKAFLREHPELKGRTWLVTRDGALAPPSPDEPVGTLTLSTLLLTIAICTRESLT